MKAPTARGFTLVELLVGLALTLGLTGAMLAVASHSLELWRRVGGSGVAEAQAAAALDLLERDIQALVVAPPGGGTWLGLSFEDDPAALERRGWMTGPRMKPTVRVALAAPTTEESTADIDAARFGRGGAWLRFFTIQPEAAGSQPVAVSYQVIRRAPGSRPDAAPSTAVRYVLCRSAVEPARTLAAGFDLESADYRTGPGGARRPATITRPSLRDDALAVNVLDFGVRLRRSSPAGEEPVFPQGDTDREFRLSGPLRPGEVLVVDVVLRIATEEGARRLAALEASASTIAPESWAEDWWRLAQAHSRAYWRRISVRTEGT